MRRDRGTLRWHLSLPNPAGPEALSQRHRQRTGRTRPRHQMTWPITLPLRLRPPRPKGWLRLNSTTVSPLSRKTLSGSRAGSAPPWSMTHLPLLVVKSRPAAVPQRRTRPVWKTARRLKPARCGMPAREEHGATPCISGTGPGRRRYTLCAAGRRSKQRSRLLGKGTTGGPGGRLPRQYPSRR
jgi:hypothetical protein